jgi:hypothetical protein
MKIRYNLLPLLALVAGLATGPATFAEGGKDHANQPSPSSPGLVAPTDKDAAWLATARAAYPLKTCLVSEEELGGMGKPADFIYREAGQPDQLVRFCCKMCVSKFKKDPAKYLAQLAPSAKPKAGSSKHHH